MRHTSPYIFEKQFFENWYGSHSAAQRTTQKMHIFCSCNYQGCHRHFKMSPKPWAMSCGEIITATLYDVLTWFKGPALLVVLSVGSRIDCTSDRDWDFVFSASSLNSCRRPQATQVRKNSGILGWSVFFEKNGLFNCTEKYMSNCNGPVLRQTRKPEIGDGNAHFMSSKRENRALWKRAWMEKSVNLKLLGRDCNQSSHIENRLQNQSEKTLVWANDPFPPTKHPGK